MFNAQIDVAKIMETIKAEAAKKSGMIINQSSQPSGSMIEVSESFGNYSAIKSELSRIDNYVFNTNSKSEQYARIGETIRMSPKSKGLGRKFKILFKRFFRKGTRFIAEDQIEVNNNTINSIRALCEYNSAFLPVLDNVNELYAQNAALRNTIDELNSIISELTSSFEAKIKEIHGRYDEIERAQLARAEEQAEIYQRRLKDFEHCVDIISERYDNVERKCNDMAALLKHTDNDEAVVSDEMYAKFLDKHRGSEEEIARRLNIYLNDLNKFDIDVEKPHLVIDLGCGRGEFLSVLKNEGINSIGVDLNNVSVEYCKTNGYNAVCDDAIEYLRNAKDESADVITAFQLIEHISLSQLNELIVESKRVLKPHGKLIMETPYSRNVEVGAYSFYTDPTHIRPVNDNYVRFLCEEAGFSKTSLYLWKNSEIEQWMDSVFKSDTTSLLDSATVRMMLNEMKQKMFVSPDYAVIAEK